MENPVKHGMIWGFSHIFGNIHIWRYFMFWNVDVHSGTLQNWKWMTSYFFLGPCTHDGSRVPICTSIAASNNPRRSSKTVDVSNQRRVRFFSNYCGVVFLRPKKLRGCAGCRGKLLGKLRMKTLGMCGRVNSGVIFDTYLGILVQLCWHDSHDWVEHLQTLVATHIFFGIFEPRTLGKWSNLNQFDNFSNGLKPPTRLFLII